jgi:hypothetical protein
MEVLFAQMNALPLYLFAGSILLFISVMCVVFIIKSYRSGLAMGMDKKVLKRAITSSATFTVLPSISILLGVIALSGALGIPLSWLRLSVVGALQYELNVAQIAAANLGMTGLYLSEMTISRFATIAMVMTVGILGGAIASIFFLKPYLKKVQGRPKSASPLEGKKRSFGDVAMVAMFVGLCSAYIGSYVGSLARRGNYMPLATALVAAAVMAVFEYFAVKKNKGWLDNFSIAASMLVAMTAAVIINAVTGGASI